MIAAERGAALADGPCPVGDRLEGQQPGERRQRQLRDGLEHRLTRLVKRRQQVRRVGQRAEGDRAIADAADEAFRRLAHGLEVVLGIRRRCRGETTTG